MKCKAHLRPQPLKYLESVSWGINLFSIGVNISCFKAQCLHRSQKLKTAGDILHALLLSM